MSFSCPHAIAENYAPQVTTPTTVPPMPTLLHTRELAAIGRRYANVVN